MLSRRTVITFEKFERCFVRLPESEPLLAHCDLCRTEVNWLTPDQVVALTGLTAREVFRRVEAETLHSSENDSGLTHICQRSLGLESETR